MDVDFSAIATPDYANVLGREHFIDYRIHPLWAKMPAISGPAFTVQLSAGDHLMMHAAIYQAPAGAIIVVDGVDDRFAVAGGNVCAVAQQRGIKGFIVDGVIRDVNEVAEMQFPVFARGVFPVPGSKHCYSELAQPICCGGVKVNSGDIIVADNEGIAVLPKETAIEVYQAAKAKADKEAAMTLSQWQANHQLRIEAALKTAKGD
ncbi:RraA family protein [Shewanella sp. Scap07]|uniref:RraA family protein n=1 Tax=Shewanella sp. Scap07 TaxID=2589987 RepID=UPI0015BC0761|nr:RraA family protein [Shewanella sp. Scap07]QLE84591.1 RraA family protein [Shewanella sp. Scap07]